MCMPVQLAFSFPRSSLDLQNRINLLRRLVFFFPFSSKDEDAGNPSSFGLLPCADPGIRRFRLARLDRFQFSWSLDEPGMIMELDRWSSDGRALPVEDPR